MKKFISDRKKKKGRLDFFIFFILLHSAASLVWALPLTSDLSLLTDKKYPRVPLNCMYNGFMPMEWLGEIRDRNSTISSYLSIEKVARVTVQTAGSSEAVSLDDYIQHARQRSSAVGANLLIFESIDVKPPSPLRFIAYRVTYKNKLFSPRNLAVLHRVSLSRREFEKQLKDDVHQGIGVNKGCGP